MKQTPLFIGNYFSGHYFEVERGELLTRRVVMSSMQTLDKRVIR
jgi:hypothetical protein